MHTLLNCSLNKLGVTCGWPFGFQYTILKSRQCKYIISVDPFTDVCLVTWPSNESETGGDLVLIETSLPLLCKFIPISMRTASLTQEKQGGFCQNKVNSSLTFIQRPGN